MVIPFVVPEILGGGGTTPPQMPLSCQKRQMPLTVNDRLGDSLGISRLLKTVNVVSKHHSDAMSLIR